MLNLKSPLACVWEITNRCNFTCPHCRSYTETPNDNEESENIIIEQLVKNEVLSVNISGGEPLLNPRIINIIKQLTKNNVDTGISTNGFIFKDKVYELIDSGVKFVQISIDGPRSFHDQFRGIVGAYDHAVESILLAKKLGLFVQMNSTITANNMKYVFDNIALAEKLGVDKLFFRRVVATGLASQNNVIPDKATYINIIKSLLKYKYSDCSRVNISIDDPIISVLDSKHYNKDAICCSAGITSLGIDCFGNVFPCIFARSRIGNLISESLSEIWNNSEILKKLRKREINICGDCEHKYSCGGCRAHSGLFSKDQFCPLG